LFNTDVAQDAMLVRSWVPWWACVFRNCLE